MAMTLQQLTDAYNALVTSLQGRATSAQIDVLTTLISVQHQTILDLVEAITTRMQVIEDWRIVHVSDTNAHASRTTPHS